MLQDKRIKIIHGGEYLLNKDLPVSFRLEMARKMTSRNIELLLKNRLDDTKPYDGNRYRTREGTEFQADLLVSKPTIRY